MASVAGGLFTSSQELFGQTGHLPTLVSNACRYMDEEKIGFNFKLPGMSETYFKIHSILAAFIIVKHELFFC
jgi:hypothetical protein